MIINNLSISVARAMVREANIEANRETRNIQKAEKEIARMKRSIEFAEQRIRFAEQQRDIAILTIDAIEREMGDAFINDCFKEK